MRKAIVLLSGGQDSTTCLYWALKEFDEVIAIGFNYGQKHVKELEQAALIAAEAKVPYQVFDLRGVFGGSSLVDHTDTNEPHKVRPDLPSSFTAGRNMVFLGIAAGLAFNQQIDTIVTGVLKHFRGNTQPFGGIQVIMVGDFCQLPPVCRAEDRRELDAAGYESEFAFSAHSFNIEDFKIFELTEVHLVSMIVTFSCSTFSNNLACLDLTSVFTFLKCLSNSSSILLYCSS